MGHHNALFPTTISYGSQSGFGFNHGIVQLRSGAKEYVSRHSDMSHVFDVAYGVKSWSDMEDLKKFYAARGGLSNSFLFQDPLDMNTSVAPYVGDGGPGTVASDDVVIETGAVASQDTVQLIKRYASGSEEHIRTIRHPVSGTVTIEVEEPPSAAAAVTEGVDYTIDYATGLVTFLPGSLLTENAIVRAGFGFYERVRFGPEVDRIMSIAAERWSIASTRSPIPLYAEIQSVPHRHELNFGGGSTVTGSFSYSPTIHGGAVYLNLAANATVVMPDAGDFPVGDPRLGFMNKANGFTATFIDHTGATLWTLASGDMADVYIMLDTGGNAWVASISA